MDHLDIEPDGGEGLDGVPQREHVEQGRLAAVLEPDETDLEFLGAGEEGAEFGEEEAHGGEEGRGGRKVG